MQHAHSEFQIFLVDHHRNLDFGGGDHLNIDAFFRQSAEHFAGDADVRTHADADHRNFGRFFIANNILRADVFLHLVFEQGDGFGKLP